MEKEKNLVMTFFSREKPIFYTTREGDVIAIDVERGKDTTALIFTSEKTLVWFFSEKIAPGLSDEELRGEKGIKRETKERMRCNVIEYLMCFETKDFENVIEPIIRRGQT